MNKQLCLVMLRDDDYQKQLLQQQLSTKFVTFYITLRKIQFLDVIEISSIDSPLQLGRFEFQSPLLHVSS